MGCKLFLPVVTLMSRSLTKNRSRIRFAVPVLAVPAGSVQEMEASQMECFHQHQHLPYMMLHLIVKAHQLTEPFPLSVDSFCCSFSVQESPSKNGIRTSRFRHHRPCEVLLLSSVAALMKLPLTIVIVLL